VAPPAPGEGCQPALVAHRVVGDPRLRHSSIADLAATLELGDIEHHIADLPLLLPSGEAPQLELTPAEVVRTIETNGCWLALFHLERHEPYRDLLECCIDGWRARFDLEGGVQSSTASLFLASSGAVTPAHVDRHHNLLLQIEGTKEVTVGAFDTAAQASAEVDRHFDPERSNFSSLPPHSTTWVLHPGEGLYLPPYAPHWVRTDGVTLSLSCVVRTPASLQLERAHICNARLRRFGLRPRPVGTWLLADRVKAQAVLLGRRARATPMGAATRRVLRSWRGD
jgi:JmjC domain